MRSLASTALGFVLLGCAGAAVPAVTEPVSPATAATSRSAAVPAVATAKVSNEPREWPELEREFTAEQVTGTIALFDTQDGVLGCSNLQKCRSATTPASTFKIAHSMIALETGVVEGPDTILPWDHQTYSNADWNEDLKFRDAFRLSCVPCYRAIARKVGEAGERDWLNKLAYGNRDTSGGVDKFWLSGGLRISPLEQVDFLRRFDGNQLPIAERTADLVRDIMTIDVTESYVLRGKTGSAAPPDEPQEANWFVGWLELGERRVFFATLLDGHASSMDPLRARRSLTERVLRAKGWL
jgi:beta-lactamase class D